eukprot:m.268694 g.268694  ORF g.268694 m.268694 type:complete len:93 (-) comp26815_c0_seq1:1170-1448(-)
MDPADRVALVSPRLAGVCCTLHCCWSISASASPSPKLSIGSRDQSRTLLEHEVTLALPLLKCSLGSVEPHRDSAVWNLSHRTVQREDPSGVW